MKVGGVCPNFQPEGLHLSYHCVEDRERALTNVAARPGNAIPINANVSKLIVGVILHAIGGRQTVIALIVLMSLLIYRCVMRLMGLNKRFNYSYEKIQVFR